MITRHSLNHFLYSLWHHQSVYTDWEYVVSNVMSFSSDSAKDKYIDGLRNKLLKIEGIVFSDGTETQPYIRAIPGSIDEVTKPLITDNLLPSIAEEAICILKDASRIMQVGPGKGKALLVVRNIGFDMDEYNAYKSVSVSTLAKDLLNRISSKDKDIAHLQHSISELQFKYSKAQQKLDALEAETSAQERISWT